MSTTIEGGCLCSGVRYRVTGPMMVGTLCHCRSCRRACGAPSMAWACFAPGDVEFIAGEPAVYASSPGVERTFCRQCGTPLTYRRAGGRTMDVATATLDDPDAFAPTKEIWTEHKLSWECTNPAMQQFARSSSGQA